MGPIRDPRPQRLRIRDNVVADRNRQIDESSRHITLSSAALSACPFRRRHDSLLYRTKQRRAPEVARLHADTIAEIHERRLRRAALDRLDHAALGYAARSNDPIVLVS